MVRKGDFGEYRNIDDADYTNHQGLYYLIKVGLT